MGSVECMSRANAQMSSKVGAVWSHAGLRIQLSAKKEAYYPGNIEHPSPCNGGGQRVERWPVLIIEIWDRLLGGSILHLVKM